MKKITYTIMCSLAFLWACDMEELPKATVSKEPVFRTETGLKMYTNSFYNELPAYTVRNTTSY